MRALVLPHHGTPDDLRYETGWPDPEPGPNDVVVAVRACALNYHDVFTMRGMPGIKVPLPVIMGIDISGEIAAVGVAVTGWQVGDRVLIDPIDRQQNKLIGEMLDGGLAELCKVAAHTLIQLPDGVGFSEAAALPTAYGTALRMMSRRGGVSAGEKVLVLGASGGVGTCCVQLAKQAGAHVIVAASSQQKLDQLAELGSDDGFNYTLEQIHHAIHKRYGKPRITGGGGVDVVVNFTGGPTWVPSLKSLAVGGRLLTCGATAGYDPQTDLRYIWTFELSIVGSNGWQRDDLHKLLTMVETNELLPIIDSTFPLSLGAEALRTLQDRKVFGKVVITPQETS